MKFFNYRVVIFLLCSAFGIVFTMPSLLQTEFGQKVSLGLDLQGGMHIRLGVKTDEAVQNKIKSISTSLKYFAQKEGILIEDFRFDESSLRFILLDSDEISKLETEIATIKGLVVNKDSELNYVITLSEPEIEVVKDMAVAQAVETIRNRLDQFGLAEPTVIRQGLSDIVVELPGIKTAEEERQARELIARPANLELMAVDEIRADQVYVLSEQKAREYGSVIMPDSRGDEIKHLLKELPILTGEDVVDARVVFDETNQPVINFTLSSAGARIFGDFTAKNIGNRLAIVLDGKVYSSPVIRERIGGGSGQISGGFSVMEAGNVAIALRSGALPASVEMLEKRSVGPSLGADSIKASMIALISGFALVIIFMIFYYGYAGIISNLALISNIFIILAVMAMFGATLTLPGMAGIVLTVGMAVDANVIINERIREFLKEGKSIAKAIEDGYSNAMRAILDANITTLLAAVILYAYGTGPIKGFAITISIGILASMITAILGTHGVYLALSQKISRDKNHKKWFGIREG
ncbi:protein translocase subunit SecD [Arcobacter sp. FWKO B]|uniref:protein translocase subunit SecD n=1 Tax=Arcobacter sp. FWKO B TaxID=2593672 RepID=UPI0018A35047|nr:protein translocase subunit SecD [Arcobacter sp. FWKO B]QOG12104.1 protein translocase subunit SecD [Arcobacter sp. FWKO B]